MTKGLRNLTPREEERRAGDRFAQRISFSGKEDEKRLKGVYSST